MDVNAIRADFPILSQQVNGRPLIYLDNAATSQLPQPVIDVMIHHMTCENANIHRGAHALGEAATGAYEQARERVAAFLNAPAGSHCIFTAGTTHGINMVARGLASQIGPGAAILSTGLEHHSDFLPWQQLAAERGAEFRSCGIDANGDLDLEQFRSLLADGKVRVAAVTACSNVTGAVTDLKPFIQAAHEADALVLVDAAQACRSAGLDVSDLGCDYLALSGHKMCAPTGIGVLYGTATALEQLKPAAYGGGMVDAVRQFDADFSELPDRLEAGTPNICGAIALGQACEYLREVGLGTIRQREEELTGALAEGLAAISGIKVLGSPRVRRGAVSIVHERLSSYDIARMMDAQGVEVRSGHHCAIPAFEAMGVKSSARISPAFYNTMEEVQACIQACAKAVELLERF